MNNKSNLQYKRLFVLNPSYYKKLIDAYEERNKLNEFGKEISDILFDKNLNDTQKYYSYLKNLSNRLAQFKSNEKITESTDTSVTNVPDVATDLTKILIKTDHTLPKSKASIETQVSPKKFRNKSVQTDAPPDQVPDNIFNANLNPPLEEIFERNVSSGPEQNEENLNVSKTVSKLPDHFLEEKLHEIAQLYSGEPNMNNIVVDKRTNNHTDFRVFKNINTNDEIAVEVKSVYDLLYNNKENINWVVNEENKLLEGKYIIITSSSGAVPLIENKQKRKSSNVSENVLETTLRDLALSNASIDSTSRDIVLERESIDKNFRIFNDKKTGKRIAIEVAPIQNHLLNKTKSLEIDVEETGDVIVLRSRKIKKKPDSASGSHKKKKKKEQQGSGSSLQWTLI